MNQRRSPAAATVSLVVHAAAIGLVLWLGQTDARIPGAPRPQSAMYLVFTAPANTVDLASEPLPMPRLTPAAPERPAAGADPPVIVAETVTPPVESPVPARPPVAPEPPKPRIVPVTGVFPDGASASASARPGRQVLDAGFEAPPARPPDIKTARAVLGAFDAPSAAAQPGTDRSTGFVAAAGFGGAPPPPRSTAARAAVGDAGFGAPESARPQSQKPTTIQTGEFAETRAPQVPAAPVKPRPERVDRIDTPVEVLFKPSPEYTDEARALKIEGEVVLEVEFCANRELRVLRVVRGLGHGLDESAVRAAKGIRFTPAQSDGRAVAFRATVNIIFRLT